MYSDSVKQWNCIIGCNFDCVYCEKSFKRMMKRQKPVIDKNGKPRGCQQCYDYEPHFHEDRLKDSLPNTKGDEFIWACSSGDIAFAKKEWLDKVLDRIKELPHKTFFMQTKDPSVYLDYEFPDNLMLGITLETNRNNLLSLAPMKAIRYLTFKNLDFPRKIVTIEPIMDFDHDIFVGWIKEINPIRVYIGYDTKKCNLPEPLLKKTLKFIQKLETFTKVKLKEIREARYCSNVL